VQAPVAYPLPPTPLSDICDKHSCQSVACTDAGDLVFLTEAVATETICIALSTRFVTLEIGQNAASLPEGEVRGSAEVS